ncbi:MAG: serine hydrolase [Chloroflexi bacterium]|nr:serine hydrolase [Chloroflexota bacterium]MDA1241382.1 serine hydrolase [Chloroflexota bacterium]
MPRTLTAEGIARIEALAREHLSNGWHTGAQVAVYRDGVRALDLRLGAGEGVGDAERWMLWFSATKPLTAVAVHVLAERGLVDLDAPIADVWPEFAQGGKASVTLRHVLTHRGGFPVLSPDFDWHRMEDWDAVAAATAGLTAQWEPGTDVGYHPVTYGFALGEVIRRVDGRLPRDFIRDEICAPLGMHASLGAATDADLARVVLPEAMSEMTLLDPEGAERRTSGIVARFRMPEVLRGQLPAANGIGTADALARFYAMLEQGGALDGARVLSSETVAEATRLHVSTEADRVTTLPSAFGLGFLVGHALGGAPFDEDGVFGHSGQQCAIAYTDPARGLAVAYLTNGLHDPYVVAVRTEEMVRAVQDACG